ncbi:MAG: type II secretion system protein GspM, partial [Pseudomonadota bacterium]
MKDWFDNLQQREQLSVLVAAVFVVFAVLYFAVWTPLTGSQSDLSASVTTWERALAELRPLKSAVR